jgi:hypothetical protein
MICKSCGSSNVVFAQTQKVRSEYTIAYEDKDGIHINAVPDEEVVVPTLYGDPKDFLCKDCGLDFPVPENVDVYPYIVDELRCPVCKNTDLEHFQYIEQVALSFNISSAHRTTVMVECDWNGELGMGVSWIECRSPQCQLLHQSPVRFQLSREIGIKL